ncbi:MAG: site-2 protease family protein [Phycisphaerales bacterium]|nr:MAG: site-2 protease family protein [Phycisphaerales bacterium]
MIFEWIDGRNQSWTIELLPERITLSSKSGQIEIAREHWSRDIYVAQHGPGFVIRFQTFENETGFAVSAQQAQPLLDHLRGQTKTVTQTVETRSEPTEAQAPLMWPKVSPIAVWALICSSLAFIPVLGGFPALAAIILLVLHRDKVRKTRVYSHSRAMCVAAVVFLVAGLCVSVLGTIGFAVNLGHWMDEPEWDEYETSGAESEGLDSPQFRGPTEGSAFPTATLRAGGGTEVRTASDAERPSTGGHAAGGIGIGPAQRPVVLSGAGVSAGPAPSTPRVRIGPARRPVLLSGVGVSAGLLPSRPPDQGNAAQSRKPHAPLGEAIWDRDYNWGMIAAGLFVVLLSLSVHECAHAITAWWLGDDYAKRLGRVSLNPLVHIDPIGTVILPLILLLADVGVFGWAKPVPTQPHYTDNPRRSHILVSIAGPGSNLLLAMASLLLLLGLGCIVSLAAPDAEVSTFGEWAFSEPVKASGFPLASVFGPLCTVLQLSFLINVFLAFFNLIPIPPLDGSWVLEHMFPSTFGPLIAKIRPFGFLLFLALIYTKVLQYLLLPVLIVLVPGFLLLKAATAF